MRILLALGGTALLRRVETAAKAIAELADHHELIVTHGNGPQVGHALEVALRNALPDRDVVSVLTQVVVAGDDPAFEPRAIAEIRSIRTLVTAGALVICAGGSTAPVAMDGLGTLYRVEATLDEGLTAALLARRLDADLLLMLTDADFLQAGPKVEAGRRFAEATGRRAAISTLENAARAVRSEAGTQISAATAVGPPHP